jgi:hypothetical protein
MCSRLIRGGNDAVLFGSISTNLEEEGQEAAAAAAAAAAG